MSLQTVLDQLEGRHVLIIGDVILDEYIWGDVNRISPEAPVPVLEIASETIRTGGAANVAQNIVNLGGRVDLVGVVGDDGNGKKLIQMLERIGVDASGICVDADRPTSTKTRVIARTSDTSTSTHQQLVRLDRESQAPVESAIHEQLMENALSRIPFVDAIVFEDYDKGGVSGRLIEGILRTARQQGKPVVVDPKVENFWNYKGVTSITPNHKEAGLAVNRKISDEDSLVSVGEEILDRLDLEGLLITRGEQGMSLFRRSPEGQLRTDHIPTQAQEVFDDTGAGDTVVAVFALALAARADMLEAAQLSNLAGGIVCGEVGCVPVNREQLLRGIQAGDAG
ncbi:MAG: D-glycero-beta-D-manno-heptose-7-phosphate kinase [Candidatus Poribacteria bacterium]|nr:D-glycero-beta-D-manno-heptose-7-phosphate kinase [Candidatus Poribacteria bacterium]MDE0504086.1 D-glycero-beta-D-manno-heptose-7-phosphate kinase [Candidatus Poribacteria bacterium]